MNKKEWKVFSVRFHQSTLDALRRICMKNSKGSAHSITINDCIRYALVKTYPSIKENVPENITE